MEFWGVEIKVGKTVTVKPPKNMVLHISQAAIGEAKKDKGNESAHLYLKTNDQKLVIGTLSNDKLPQILLDLVLERECELSHNWKNGSVYLSGYYCELPADTSDSEDLSNSEDGGNIPLTDVEAKPNTATIELTEKKRVSFIDAKKDEGSDEDDASDSSGDSDSSSDDQMLKADGIANNEETSEDDDSDDEDSDDSDDEDSDDSDETPAQTKKRPADSNVKTPSQKNAKLVTPLKTDEKKKGVHTATPHPAKHAGKASTSSGQAKQTPKSSGSFSCKSCGRSFGSEIALQSHSKAKHGSVA